MLHFAFETDNEVLDPDVSVLNVKKHSLGHDKHIHSLASAGLCFRHFTEI